jgi:2-aminobenzoate-CoA ligase
MFVVVDLLPGANVALPGAAVTIGLRGPFDLSALVVGTAGQVGGDADMVFWNAPDAPGVRLDGAELTVTPERLRRGATGYAIPGYQAAVLNESNEPCRPGEVGRLAVKGPTGCRYLADERQKNYVQGGWNITGDRYYLDEDGYFWFQARTDDMIISAGYNIAGPEVEGALLTHPAVSECAVVGAPDAERGTIVKAFVVLKKDFSKDDSTVKILQEHVKKVIAPYKYPRAIEFVETLPRTETGKLQRFKLRSSP